jgi:hypothetical protein
MKEAIPFDGGLIAYRSEATMIVVQHSFEDMRNVQGDVKAGLDPLIFGILAGETKAFLVESIVPRQDFEGSWWVKGKLDINESGYLMVIPGHECLSYFWPEDLCIPVAESQAKSVEGPDIV